MNSALTQFSENTRTWFERCVGTPTPVQEQGWPAIASGGHALISAPTGAGKTLSAFLVFIDRLKAMAAAGELKNELYLIYVSPLKALGNDIRENLRRPLDGIEGPQLNVAIRTGDTSSKDRRRMIKTPPHILITTPESLYLLLTSLSGREMLKTSKAVVLDELHSIINSKRGAHLMLSLARLDRLCGENLQRVGLSATIEPLERAAEYLAALDPVTIVAPKMEKAVDILVMSPLPDMRTLPEGTIWPEIAKAVIEHCQNARTVIAFTENRMNAEKLALYVNKIAGSEFALTHHGCVSKEQRLEAERRLRGGELRLLCATSSMELGIDVGEVDLVIQIGYPRTISSAMQRLGRAGHNPGRTSVMRVFPRTAAEGIYCGMTAKAALDGGIEQSAPPDKCLDVLAQHLVSMAAGEEYTVDDALALLKRAYNFRTVTRAELEGVLEMLAGDYEHRQDRPARPRILYDRVNGLVKGDAYSRMLAIAAGGTIPDKGMYSVKLPDGTKLGELDEEFVFEARVGDKFLLGAFAWKVAEFQKDSVIVQPTNPEGAQSPFWKGDWNGRPYQTGLRFGAMLRDLNSAQEGGRLFPALIGLCMDAEAASNAAEHLSRQIQATGFLPDDRTIIVEHFSDDTGENQIMVHSVFGKRVNAGLSLLAQRAASEMTGMDIHSFDDDDGFLLFPYNGDRPMPEGILTGILPQQARPILTALLPVTPVFNMAFRYNAARALMMGTRKGKRQPLWVQRLRGAEALDMAIPYENHPLIEETTRECLEDYWDLPAIEEVLQGVQSGHIEVRELHLTVPSPMSLPLRRQTESVLLYDYTPMPSSARRAVDEALAEAAQSVKPSAEQLAPRRGRQPEGPDQLHSLMMTEGDLVADDILNDSEDKIIAPPDWLDQLALAGRVLYIEPGLWICKEQEAEYAEAFIENGRKAQKRIVRRALRFRGPQTPESLSERYFWDAGHCEALLDELAADGAAVLSDGLYYHEKVYSRAVRQTVAERRRQARTEPPEHFAALMAARIRTSGSPEQQLREGLSALEGVALPPALWESAVLPARTAGYAAAMLDRLLAQGEWFWRMSGEERTALAFYRVDDIDWDGGLLSDGAALTEAELQVINALKDRGASFAHSLAGLFGGETPLEVLYSLMEKGLARCDGFEAVRQWLKKDRQNARTPRQKVRGRVMAMEGRWELTRPLKLLNMETLLERAFDRCPLLCRETARGVNWQEALQTLRIWEYAGRLRRGYFVSGLSGAQFIRERDYARTLSALSGPNEIVWLNAADPFQLWGGALSHEPSASFICVGGTAAALRGGKPAAVFEKSGETLRIFEPDAAGDVLTAFARQYQQSRIFPDKKRVTVKRYPDYTEELLCEAGFSRQMNDYVLWRNPL